jgi:hypothetical protein
MQTSEQSESTPISIETGGGKGEDGALHTPDGRYVIVDGRLWRAANPKLDLADKERLVTELMSARRAVKTALQTCDADTERTARRRVHKARLALGERGPAWWGDDVPDFTRRLVKNSPYAGWFASLR